MKALVTGVAGFVGSTLAESLTGDGIEVVGLDCFTDYYGRAAKERNLEALRRRPAFQFVEDALQTAPLEPLLDGVTHVFHLAAQAGVRASWGADFRTYTSHNVDATQRLLEALRRAGAATSLAELGVADEPFQRLLAAHPELPRRVLEAAHAGVRTRSEPG